MRAVVDGRPTLVDNPDSLIPIDAVRVPAAEVDALLSAQQEGMQIIARGGRPIAVNVAPADAEAVREIVRSKRDQTLLATEAIAADPTLTPEQQSELEAYREALKVAPAAVSDTEPDVGAALPEPPRFLREAHIVLP